MNTLKAVNDHVADLTNRFKELQTIVQSLHTEHENLLKQCHELKTKNTELTQLVATLNQEKAGLEQKLIKIQAELSQQVAALYQEKADLQQKLQNDHALQQKAPKLSGEAIKILMCIRENQYCFEDKIVQKTSLDIERVKFWITKLKDMDMVGGSHVEGVPTGYFLMEDGREYLIDGKNK